MFTSPHINNDVLFIIKSIKNSTEKEEEYEFFYNYLLTAAPNYEEAEIIRTIRDETRRHYEVFDEMYKELTGLNLPPRKQFYISPDSYLDSLKKAVSLEIGAVDDYKIIRNLLPPTSPYKEVLLNIITDEINHANKFNFLLNINNNKNINFNKI